MPEPSPSCVPAALALAFTEARTHRAWLDRPVDPAVLRAIYETARWAPTAFNASPLRVLFVTSPEARERLLPALETGNREKSRTAPVTAVFAYDSAFADALPRLAPRIDAMQWAEDSAGAEAFARRSATLQVAYVIIAARLHGLDCGPMSGFDAEALDRTFFSSSSWRSLLVCNLGYGDPALVRPRAPRLAFDEACRIA